jgi:hypothetical protein
MTVARPSQPYRKGEGRCSAVVFILVRKHEQGVFPLA